MLFKNSILILLTVLLWTSCDDNKSKGSESTGAGSEILVVCSKQIWDGPLGDSIRLTLTRDLEGLLPAEPEFTLIHISEKDFSSVLKTRRNVLTVGIIPKIKIGLVETLVNVWSHPQRVVKVEGSCDTAILNGFSKNSEAIRELFNQNERAWFSSRNALNPEPTVEKMLKDDLGLKLEISKGFQIIKKEVGFASLRSDSDSAVLGLMIYTFPYRDASLLNPDSIIAARNRYSKKSRLGLPAGTLTTFVKDTLIPVSEKLIFKDMLAVKTWGLWNNIGDSEVGPFINYSIIDAPRQRVIVFDGFVKTKQKAKRDYIRQFESIFWGTEFLNATQ